MANSTALLHLKNGSYIRAATSAYTAVMGDWWYFIIYIFSLLFLYLATKNHGAVGIMGIIGAAYMRFATDMSEALYPILYLMAVLSFAMLLYGKFGKGK